MVLFPIKDKGGQTVLEALVGMGLIAIVGFSFVSGILSLRNLTQATTVLSSSERQVMDIAENIRNGVESYQINFDDSDTSLERLRPEVLPMAWDSGRFGTREACPQCQGSYGYEIKALPSYPGLYEVTLRLTHKSWSQAGELYRDYKFLVSSR